MRKPRIRLSPNLGFLRPSERSYWGFQPDFKLISIQDFKEKESFTPTEQRMLQNELSGREPIEYVVVLDNKNKALGRFTRGQVMEMLNDMGFNVVPKVSGSHASDFSALMNVKGFVLPGWSKFVDLFPIKLEKLLLTKYSPGKERLHIRVYENNDGTWLITAHTDFNWLNLNLYQVYKAHLTHGAGDYRMGTTLLMTLFQRFTEHLAKNENMPVEDIISSIKAIYRNGVDAFYAKLKLLIIFILSTNCRLFFNSKL